ncbi:MAG TPA: hypothetical protein VM492_18220 [Sumerlaeia bacterium]|nr:hypothetical protein [Sumerlaeia bacterium]
MTVALIADVLWIRKGKAAGAIAGILTGTGVIVWLAFLLPEKLYCPWSVHYGFWAFLGNVAVFALFAVFAPRTRGVGSRTV